MVAGRLESLVEWDRSKRAWIGTAGAAGLAPREPKISTNVYISLVYIVVQ